MYSYIKATNLINKKTIFLESNIDNTGIVLNKFTDSQTKGEFEKMQGLGQIGKSINSTFLAEREIAIEGTIIGVDEKQVDLLKRQLVSIFNPMQDVLLEYTDNYINKAIIVRATGVPIINSDNTNDLFKNFLLALEAEYPLWQDQVETAINVETWKNNFEFPLDIPSDGIEIGIKGANKIEFINNGDMEAPLEFYFKAPALNPIIKLNNNEYIKVNKKLNDGETLYICTAYGKKKVEIIKPTGERENAYGYIDIFSTFFKLPVGSNIISYSTEGDFIPQLVIVKYKNQYLSL